MSPRFFLREARYRRDNLNASRPGSSWPFRLTAWSESQEGSFRSPRRHSDEQRVTTNQRKPGPLFTHAKTCRNAFTLLTCLSVGFAALLAALSTPSLASQPGHPHLQAVEEFHPVAQPGRQHPPVRQPLGGRGRRFRSHRPRLQHDRHPLGRHHAEGFDCSGLVNYVFQDVDDVDLPRTARAIYNMDNNKVSRGKLQPGDLVFFRIRSRSVDHVGIYVGNDRFVHAPRVRVSDLNSSYWKRHCLAGKRILPTTLAQVESTRKR